MPGHSTENGCKEIDEYIGIMPSDKISKQLRHTDITTYHRQDSKDNKRNSHNLRRLMNVPGSMLVHTALSVKRHVYKPEYIKSR